MKRLIFILLLLPVLAISQTIDLDAPPDSSTFTGDSVTVIKGKFDTVQINKDNPVGYIVDDGDVLTFVALDNMTFLSENELSIQTSNDQIEIISGGALNFGSGSNNISFANRAFFEDVQIGGLMNYRDVDIFGETYFAGGPVSFDCRLNAGLTNILDTCYFEVADDSSYIVAAPDTFRIWSEKPIKIGENSLVVKGDSTRIGRVVTIDGLTRMTKDSLYIPNICGTTSSLNIGKSGDDLTINGDVEFNNNIDLESGNGVNLGVPSVTDGGNIYLYRSKGAQPTLSIDPNVIIVQDWDAQDNKVEITNNKIELFNYSSGWESCGDFTNSGLRLGNSAGLSQPQTFIMYSTGGGNYTLNIDGQSGDINTTGDLKLYNGSYFARLQCTPTLNRTITFPDQTGEIVLNTGSTMTGSLILKSVTYSTSMNDDVAGTAGEIVFCTSDSKFYGCTLTGGAGAATWAVLH